jgi:hypothetical protein
LTNLYARSGRAVAPFFAELVGIFISGLCGLLLTLLKILGHPPLSFMVLRTYESAQLDQSPMDLVWIRYKGSYRDQYMTTWPIKIAQRNARIFWIKALMLTLTLPWALIFH